MEASTPVAGSSKQEERRVLFGGRTSQVGPLRMNVSEILTESDDRADLAERRNAASLRRSIVLQQSAANSSATLSDSIRRLSSEDIRSQLQIFCKLHAENKINSKNLWNIRIIDVLRLLVTKDYPDVLKLATESLEVAGKVYALRVDDLHAEAMKLASSLARNFAAGSREDKEHEENRDVNAANNENQQKKRQPIKKRLPIAGDKKCTISADPKAFLAPLPKSGSATFLVRTDPRLSEISNLFTNRIKMDNTGCNFMFPKKDGAWAWTPGSDSTVKPDANKKGPTIHLPPVENYKICAEFKDFRVDKWDSDLENKDLERRPSMLEDVVFDDNGIPIPELDGSIRDIFEERSIDQLLNDEDPLEEETAAPLICHEKEHIVNFEPTTERLTNAAEQMKGAGGIDQMWAGPNHWNHKRIKSKPMTYSGMDGNQPKNFKRKTKTGARKKEKEYDPIDLCKLKPPWDFSKPYKPARKIKGQLDEDELNKPTLDSSSIKLLEDKEYSMTIPTLKVKDLRPQNEFNYGVPGFIRIDTPCCSTLPSQYNLDENSNRLPGSSSLPEMGQDNNEVYDNGDHLPGSSNSRGNNLNLSEMDNNDVPNDDHSSDSPANFQEQVSGFTGNNLVELPEMVPQSYMSYAIKAKKIDMKKLKDSIWCTLTNRDEIDPSAKVTPISFCEMYKKMLGILPKRMATTVSKPDAFVALLHLCNEQTLALQKQDNLSDFDIQGSED